MLELEQLVTRTCLNGWWDFQPRFDADTPADCVPDNGWLEGQYLVPSFWTKPPDAVRRKGETLYRSTHDLGVYDDPDAEFLFDAFGYPNAWSKTRSAWVRRTFAMDGPQPGRRYFLIFDGVMPRARLFVNGHEAAAHIHPTLPLVTDVTPWLHRGGNEIAVLIEDYEQDERGRALVPTGNTIPCHHSGIWQNVWLVERAEVYLSDITIRTSTRTRTLHIDFEVTNASDRARSVTLSPTVCDWEKGVAPEAAQVIRQLPNVVLHVAPGGVATGEVEVEWEDAVWWYPEQPKLYQIRTEVRDAEKGGATLETTMERFGFREVWIDGPNILLNGYPLHLFSDWGHKWTPYYYTEGWIRQWFGMIRDANMNHSRLHTHPHPPLTLDIADEEGILITGEAGLHGSGGAQAGSSPAYWDAAADHVRRFVRRDKNHPSVILWSVENEMRWNTKGEGASAEAMMIQQELPKLRHLFEELDPTRPAYHEGDSSLWNEKTQPIISRHYGKECAGIGWWDRAQPLHSGEMALYHYAGPNTTLHLGGDAVYASFEAIDRVAAQDAALIIETGRTLGVSCWGPWNLSCLENPRMTPHTMTLDYADVTLPGVKPLQAPGHSSEFAFWQSETEPGYTPNTSFAIQAHAFRPFAVIDRSLRTGYFTGAPFHRDLFVVNDTPGPIEGRLTVSVHRGAQLVHRAAFPVAVGRGQVISRRLDMTIPPDAQPGVFDYSATFEADGQALDAWTRQLNIRRPVDRVPDTVRAIRLGVYGPGTLDETLTGWECPFTHVPDLDATTLAEVDVLLLEKRTVEPSSQQNLAIQAFARRGGRVIVLEQETSLFPALALVDKPVLGAFRRSPSHPVVAEVEDADLFAWGDDPYPLLASDAYVALRMYEKDDGRLMLPLLDSGEGGFGSGTLGFTPLFELREGAGLILACQLRLTDKLAQIPTAEQMLLALLERAATFDEPAGETPTVKTVAGDTVEELEAYVEAARQGATVIVTSATPAAVAAWARALGQDLTAVQRDAVYQVIRTADDPALRGVSNEDLCGIETYSYTPSTAANYRVGSVFLAPVNGLEPLLQTPTESLLRELMVYGGRSEALRAHTLSQTPDDARTPLVALGRVRVGKGAILFNQFAPKTEDAPETEDRPRLRRLRHRLLANHGWRFEGSCLDGDAVPTARPNSPGYPRVIHTYMGALDEDLYREMLESCLPSLERMLAMPILNLGQWQTVHSETGAWRAGELSGNHGAPRDVVLYHTIWSPAPRKNLDTNLDVPNPEALTFLDLDGEGRVEVAVNGRRFDPLSLEGGGATVSDIPLEMGGNHVLIRWTPEGAGSTLTLRWRNIMRQPEVGLLFDAAGSAN